MKKWLRRVFLAVVILAGALVGAALVTALRTAQPVGFQVIRASSTQDGSITVGVWYPTTARPRPTTLLGPLLMSVAPDGPVSGRNLPLVVISHGNGGGPGSHADLALALADSGYVVAAPMHPGDNYADQGAAGSVSLFSGRNRQLRATVDYMLGTWVGRDHIDPKRIGAFGLSAGAFTVLTAVGARPDLRLVASHCAKSPEFVCDVLRHAQSPLLARQTTPMVGGAFATDERIKAVVVAAPGLGFTMADDGLTAVQVPVQLWSGEADVHVPFATNARLVRDALGPRVEFHSVAGAGHFSFLAPCGLLAPPALCSDAGQFDRKAFHREMNARVVAFFDANI